MSNLKYTVIKTKRQYNEYCDTLKDLDSTEKVNRETEEEIELLTLLIENYDAVHNNLGEFAPIPLLKELMAEHKMKATDLVNLLEISKGYVSDILNLRKGLSKDVIRKLAAHFHLHQEAFNRPYPLVAPDVKAAKTTKPVKPTRSMQKAKTSKITKHAKARSSKKKNVAA